MLRSPLNKQYLLSQTCAGELTETPGKVTGKYCGCRWCLVCSRIRTSRLIVGYMPAIELMGDNKYLLTLSRPSVSGRRLKDEISHYLKCASLINRHLREKTQFKKNKYNSQPTFSSLRKIECTYNEDADTYHPHFHIIFDNFLAADIFLTQWLARNPTAKLNKGNQLKKADAGAGMELFKYFTKVVSKAKNGKSGDYRIHIAALDTMFVAMRAVRTFQPCGVIKAVSEEIEPEIAEQSGREELNFWKWHENDWINPETAELLTNWTPSPAVQDIVNHVVVPRQLPTTVDFRPLPASTFDETSEPVLLTSLPNSPLMAKKRPSVPLRPAAHPPALATQITFFEGLAGVSLPPPPVSPIATGPLFPV